ncbi:hypothetical protein MOD24_14665 [Bacillus haynesii]|uniref:hypothetical protein n=1 Tax=Bacillus haynesii TaxID=1925021 RepID=UPI00227E50C1|nr:hypothetical protein [Bacillus haynesii]MCY8577089.1 hypothetical protein [Bacillus haynesii]MEC1657213.1 hypothetical protein [Bacillus haynesii]
MGKMDEMILVAKRKEVFNNEALTFQGVSSDDTAIKEIMKNISNHYKVMRRGDAEENPEFKQPIPYVVIKRGDELFLYERLKGAGESRLHNQLSLGFGGHMNETDGESFKDVLYENTYRELEEELEIEGLETAEIKPLGLINDDENEVGTVHIGILYAMELSENAAVTVKETDQISGRWVKIAELENIYDRLETWSQFVAKLLNKM